VRKRGDSRGVVVVTGRYLDLFVPESDPALHRTLDATSDFLVSLDLETVFLGIGGRDGT
jgi:hypothetical protein